MVIFVLDLHCCPGHFFSAASASPGFVALSRTFPYRRTISSRFCGTFQDISLLPHHFLPEKWCFSGHFLPSTELSPGNEASFRTFPFCALWNFLFLKIAVFKKSATLKVFLFPKKDFTHLL